uniref:Uncharacterized protein n=1 Tax=Ciona savignyi TaxID=51511 RepID=H2Z3B8_CIOSA
ADLGKPRLRNRGFGNPGLENRDFGKPGLENRDFGKPGLENRDFGKPGLGNRPVFTFKVQSTEKNKAQKLKYSLRVEKIKYFLLILNEENNIYMEFIHAAEKCAPEKRDA